MARKILDLNGKWKLYYYPQNAIQVKHPDDLSKHGVKHIDATVPGNVEIDLQKAGEIDDPFWGDNIHNIKQYEFYEWWYEKEFDTPVFQSGQTVKLIFYGVDCIATYWLNGEKIGESRNMFIEHELDITSVLNKNGKNKLFVQLSSAVIEAMGNEIDPYMSALPTNIEQLWIRKAPHSYGWDIMPRALSAGIWRKVELLAQDKHEIKNFTFNTISANENRAVLICHYNIKTEPAYLGDLELCIVGMCKDKKFEIKRKLTFSSGFIKFEVENPYLWWPRGYGAPDIYQATILLLYKDEVLAERSETFGIRTVKLLKSEVAGKENKGQFLFKINDVPIMCKGSNWLPADVFHSRDAERIEKILDLFIDLNCNILRCWGGNVYEDHEFFNICDRNGIMVWQDFAMACAAHPHDEKFLEELYKEIRSVIRKLRNHPSIIAWCGDNEADYNYYNFGMDPNKNIITRDFLPQIVFRNDPYRPFIPTSPFFSSKVVENKNMDLLPENHLWGPRDNFKSRYYTETKAHFIGEIGYHGCPNLSSIKKFIDEEHIWPWHDNTQWITHCTAPQGKDSIFSYRLALMADQINELFGIVPIEIEDFILASQISQAEAKKFFIEMVRVDKWNKTGIIWWNVMDGWPQFSDAIVDYYFGKKLAYYYIKRVQQPVCIIIKEPENWHVKVVVANDSREVAVGTYRVWDADSGEILLEGNFNAVANQNHELGSIRVSNSEQRMLLIEWHINGKKFANHYLHGKPAISLARYKDWIKKIAGILNDFDAERIGE